MLTRQFLRTTSSPLIRRQIHKSAIRLYAKNDDSTIDSYRLPSQTSINEWEFKYDFVPKVSEPKVPALTPEAVKQDIAHERRAKVEKEILDKELATSIKVEANDSHVVHGGESVGTEPEYLQDRGSQPVDISRPNPASQQPGKPANRDKYIQTSINPEINSPDVSSLSHGEVSHKTTSTEGQSQVLEEVEEEDHHKIKSAEDAAKASGSGTKWLLTLGGAAVGYYGYQYFQEEKK